MPSSLQLSYALLQLISFSQDQSQDQPWIVDVCHDIRHHPRAVPRVRIISRNLEFGWIAHPNTLTDAGNPGSKTLPDCA